MTLPVNVATGVPAGKQLGPSHCRLCGLCSLLGSLRHKLPQSGRFRLERPRVNGHSSLAARRQLLEHAEPLGTGFLGSFRGFCRGFLSFGRGSNPATEDNRRFRRNLPGAC